MWLKPTRADFKSAARGHKPRHRLLHTEFIMADRPGKPRYESMKTRRVRIESLNSNMAVSEAKTSTAPVLLKERDISEASVAGRKPAEFGKADLLFWQRFKRDRESTARKTTVYFLMFTSNDAGPLVSLSQIRV